MNRPYIRLITNSRIPDNRFGRIPEIILFSSADLDVMISKSMFYLTNFYRIFRFRVGFSDIMLCFGPDLQNWLKLYCCGRAGRRTGWSARHLSRPTRVFPPGSGRTSAQQQPYLMDKLVMVEVEPLEERSFPRFCAPFRNRSIRERHVKVEKSNLPVPASAIKINKVHYFILWMKFSSIPQIGTGRSQILFCFSLTSYDRKKVYEHWLCLLIKGFRKTVVAHKTDLGKGFSYAMPLAEEKSRYRYLLTKKNTQHNNFFPFKE